MKSKNSRKIIVHILLLLGITITVFPFVWMILTSFKTVGEAMQIPPTIFPKKFLTDAYSSIVTALPFGRVYLNTIISTVVTTVVQVLFCSMAAYAFARIEFPFKNAIFVLVLSVLMVPGQIFLIPQYRIVQSLGLLDTIPALFLPNLFSAFGTFLLRQFFMSLPKELEEAALLDGCNRFQIFGRIMLPLTKAGIVSLVIFTAKFAWNDFMWPLIVNTSMDKMTLVLTEQAHKYRISPVITNITSVYGRCPNVIKTAFFNACVVLHTKCEMIGKTYKNTDNATRHTHQRRMRITANSVVFCELMM